VLNPLLSQEWADYFKENGIEYIFFSAKLASEENEALSEESVYQHAAFDQEIEGELQESNSSDSQSDKENSHLDDTAAQEISETREKKEIPEEDKDIHIYGALELSDLFEEIAPIQVVKDEDGNIQVNKATIGLVGYPNVGKSSTINALLGAKKVTVSATPGKTKHFQVTSMWCCYR
jgi:large subunit GTPase 1